MVIVMENGHPDGLKWSENPKHWKSLRIHYDKSRTPNTGSR